MGVGDLLDDRQAEPAAFGRGTVTFKPLVAQQGLLEGRAAQSRSGVVNLDAMSRPVASQPD